MKFDFQKFRKQLEPYKVEKVKKKKSRKGKGYLNVIHYVWTHTPTHMVDFDSFTKEDIYDAIDEMEALPLYWDDTGEYFTCDPMNDFMLYDIQLDIVYRLANAKEKKFVLEDDDLFL